MAHQQPTLDSREAGFSFIEATIASVLLVSLAGLVATMSRSGMQAQQFNQRMSRVTEISQGLADDIRTGLAASVRLIGAGADGEAYRAMCQIPTTGDFTMPVPIDSARLPLVSTNGRFDLESAGDPRTGNDLMFARYAWTFEYEAASSEIYRVDVYRIERYYLTPVNGGPRAGTPVGLNFAHWVSEPLAEASQIDTIQDKVDRDEVLSAMRNSVADRFGTVRDEVQVVWMLGEDPSLPTTLREIGLGGDLDDDPSAPRSTTWEIEPDPSLCEPNLLDYRHHSVATNFAAGRLGVGRFGLEDTDGDGFPHGFEIQVVGPSSSREVLIHLTLVSTRGDGQRAFHDVQVVSDIRDV